MCAVMPVVEGFLYEVSDRFCKCLLWGTDVAMNHLRVSSEFGNGSLFI